MRCAASMSSQESKPPPELLPPSGSAGALRRETASSSLVRVGEREQPMYWRVDIARIWAVWQTFETAEGSNALF